MAPGERDSQGGTDGPVCAVQSAPTAAVSLNNPAVPNSGQPGLNTQVPVVKHIFSDMGCDWDAEPEGFGVSPGRDRECLARTGPAGSGKSRASKANSPTRCGSRCAAMGLPVGMLDDSAATTDGAGDHTFEAQLQLSWAECECGVYAIGWELPVHCKRSAITPQRRIAAS